jgi:vacuolar protein sorting-associated protein 26
LTKVQGRKSATITDRNG